MDPYVFGPFRLDVAERRLLRDGHATPLTPKAFDLLRILLEHSGHLVTKEALMQQLWHDTFVDEANLNRCVAVARKALGDGADGRRYIETIPKSGYRFVAPVTRLSCTVPALTAHAPQDRAAVPFPVRADRNRSSQQDWVAARRRVLALAAAAIVPAVGVFAYGLLAGRVPVPPTKTTSPVHTQITFAGHERSPALSPDGRRIAYVSSASEPRKIIVQELPGGQPVTILTEPEAGNLRWSPDGSALLFFARGNGPGGVFVVSRFGGVPRRIATGQFVACWSPDGKTIAVAHYLAGRIRLVDAAGRSERSIPVAGAQRWIADLDWSAAADRLLVAGNDVRGRYTMWSLRPDGSDQREIVAEEAEIRSARWAPGGDAVYYFRRADQTFSLVKVLASSPAKAAAPAALLTGLEADGSFAVSADGTRLVYARAPYYSNLYVVEGVESAHSKLTARQLTYGTALVERPRVSPDGTQVLFNIGHDAFANLYTVPITGGQPAPLTFFHSFNVGGVWSPDGRSIAFASTEGRQARVWLMSAGGGNMHPLSSGELSDSFDVLWAPATQILYQQAGNRNYYVLDPATLREQPLMPDASLGWVFSPVSSPDGTRIAFAWSRTTDYGLWIADTRKSTRKLVYSASVPTPVGWSADGTWIYAIEGQRAAYRGLSTTLGETSTHVKVLKVSETGVARTLFELPFDEVGGITMSPDGRSFVCSVYSSRSDVWIVENFDAGAGSD